MTEQAVDLLDEGGRWRARDVLYRAGTWRQLEQLIPLFTTEEFKADDEAPPNPYLTSVVRQPLTRLEQKMSIAVVSRAYSLAQHRDVAVKCIEGIQKAGIETSSLRCELGLTEFGEWMNFRIYFPDDYEYIPADGKPIRLRLECFNSVDGSSRLIILLGWFRFICSNGMVIGDTRTELRDIHNQSMNLSRIPDIIGNDLRKVDGDLERIRRLESIKNEPIRFEKWINHALTKAWGKKAACRVFHICLTGNDVEISDPFASGDATEKPVREILRVPGARKYALNIYDVGQALSWVATQRNNSEQRLEWQSDIPSLLDRLERQVSIGVQ